MKHSPMGCRAVRAVAGLAMLLLLAQTSCSSPDPAAAASPADGGAFPADTYATVMSTSGALSIAVRTSPQPPAVGTDDVQFTITKASDGTPVDGLTLVVEPWMPSMGHGTSAAPTVTPQGDGVYLVSNVYLFMQGVWALRTTISGPMSDDAAPQLQIQ